MMTARTLVLVSLALGAASVALAQQPVQLKFSRVVDLTIPIESNMPGIPGIKTYVDNPSKVDVVTAITEAQKGQLETEGMTLNSNLAVNGRAMISVLSILVRHPHRCPSPHDGEGLSDRPDALGAARKRRGCLSTCRTKDQTRSLP